MGIPLDSPRARRLGAASSALALALLPQTAHAAGGSASTEDVAAVLGVMLLVGFAYVVTERGVDWIEERYLIKSGIGPFLVGVALSGAGLWEGVPQIRNVERFFPVVALAAGWVGLLRGVQLASLGMRDAPRGLSRVVIVHHLIPGAAVGSLAFFGFQQFWGDITGTTEISPGDYAAIAIASCVLGVCAASDSRGPFDLLARRYEVGGNLAGLLRRAAHLGDAVVIAAFGLVVCAFHAPVEGQHLDPSHWTLITIGIGGLLGLLFRPFVAGDQSANARFLALVGIITFAAGAAHLLQVSALAVNLILGFTIVSTASHAGRAVEQSLQSTEAPVALVLWIIAGIFFRPTHLITTMAGIVGFIALRFLGKQLGSWLAAFGTDLRKDLHKGLLTHGDTTVAMAVSFRLLHDGPAAELAYTVIIVSVILHDLVGPRVLRSLLFDAGDLALKGVDSAATRLVQPDDEAAAEGT